MVKKKNRNRMNACIKVVEASQKYRRGREKEHFALALFRKEGKPEENMILLEECREVANTFSVQDKLLFALALFEKE